MSDEVREAVERLTRWMANGMDCHSDDTPSRERLKADLRAILSTLSPKGGWNEDMTRLPAAVTLIFRDPIDEDGCEIVRLGLSTDAMNAEAWSYLPGVAHPSAGDREAIARIIDPEAFADTADEPRIVQVRAGKRQREALAKADAILALTQGDAR